MSGKSPAEVTDCDGTERRRFADYVAAVSPQLTLHGGRHLALAPAAAVEAYGYNDGPTCIMLSRWASSATLRAFWHSREHRNLRNRLPVEAFAAIALDASGQVMAPTADAALAIFLGAGPSPALLEAEGARPLALAREAQIEAIEGAWTHGDVAVYGWASAQDARRQMLMFSSGQRARAILVPALPMQQSLPPPDPPGSPQAATTARSRRRFSSAGSSSKAQSTRRTPWPRSR